MNELKQPQSRRILPIISVITFIGFLDTHLLLPVMALYASQLGAGVGIIGLIIGLYSITNTLANLLFGRLIDIHYTRNDMSPQRGTFRVRGDIIEIYPAYEKYSIRIDTFGDEVDNIVYLDTTTGEILDEVGQAVIYPASHHVTTQEKMKNALETIGEELRERLEELRSQNKLLEAQLLKLRESLGTKVIYKRQATKQILHSLRENSMIALLIDQNVLKSQAVFVDFFGKKAATTPSLAAFFLRTRAPLLPVFCHPTSSHMYQLKIFPPLKISLEEDYDQDILKITQICTMIIEDQIRKNPSYWLWFHNRWKTRPEGER